MGKKLKIAGITIVAAAAAGAAVAWVVRDQVTRHRRDLFSPHALQRLAALLDRVQHWIGAHQNHRGKAKQTADRCHHKPAQRFGA